MNEISTAVNPAPAANVIQTTGPATPVPPPDKLKEIKEKLTEQDKEAFFKAFISDQPYQDTLVRFKGALKLKFSTLTVEQNNHILEQQRFDIEKGIAKNNDEYMIKVIQYRIAAGLTAINDELFGKGIDMAAFPANKEKGETYLLKRIEAMAKWNTFKLGNITDAFNEFEMKVQALTEESFKENF